MNSEKLEHFQKEYQAACWRHFVQTFKTYKKIPFLKLSKVHRTYRNELEASILATQQQVEQRFEEILKERGYSDKQIQLIRGKLNE